jgi:hypothetical protein
MRGGPPQIRSSFSALGPTLQGEVVLMQVERKRQARKDVLF